MRKRSLLIFGVLVGLSFATIATTTHKAFAAVGNWQKGILVQPRWNTDFSSSSFQQSMNNAVADGVNYVTLVIPVHQSSIQTTDIQAGNDTPTDQSLRDAISYLRTKKISVALSIHDDPYDGNWRAYINPSDRTSWFNNYTTMLDHYADIAQTTGAQQIVIGTEMSSMTLPSVNAGNTAHWLAMIASARQHFSGLLTYSAQHDGYMGEASSIGFWPQLDFIGISAYYGLGWGDQSVSSIEQSWNVINQNSLASLASKYGKQIVFTEVGYVSQNNSLGDPGVAYTYGGSPNLTLQSNAYQALFDYWNNYGYFGGSFMWDWSSDPNAGGASDSNYTPQGKPAEQIMKQWFNISSGGMGGGGTITPTNPTTNPANATYTTTGSLSTSLTTGVSSTVSASVSASANVSSVLVDVELYDQAGNRVAQQFYDNQSLSTKASSYSFNWTPTSVGTYTVKVGVFTSGWASNLTWNGQAVQGTVSAPITTPVTPPVTTPAPPMTTPPSSSPSNIDVWWPGDGTTVSGVQPFKALIDGVDQSSYAMYWQVDGGQLNAMSTNTSPIAHKESSVDLSSWDWSSSGQYTITFVAKDTSGNVIAKKSVIITVSH